MIQTHCKSTYQEQVNECKRQSNWKSFKNDDDGDDDEEAAAAADVSFNKCLLSRRRELHFQGNGKFFLKRFLWSPHCAVHQSVYMVQDTTANSTFHNYFISVSLFFLRTSLSLAMVCALTSELVDTENLSTAAVHMER